MKAAFFFDTVLLKDKDENYFGMTLTYDFLKQRYLKIFDELYVATRIKEMTEVTGNIDGYRKTNGPNIYVNPITQYVDVLDALKNNKKIKTQVDEIVKNVDKLIIRMPSVIGMFACKSAKKFKKQYLIEMVACPWDGYMNHVRTEGKILAPIMYFLNRKYIKEAPKVLYVTDEFLQRRYPTNGKSIACSDVVLSEVDEGILEKRLSKIEESDMNTLKIATIASVELKYKGQEYVIKAISKLIKKGKKVNYYLAGGGDSSRLKALTKKFDVEEQVYFLGSLPHEEVFKLVDDIDLYIQPSLQEGLPRALIEAMSRACPAIGSTAGGIPELLDNQYVFKKKDYKKIEEFLLNLNKKEFLKMAKENYEKAKKFDKTILEEKRDTFYRSI